MYSCIYVHMYIYTCTYVYMKLNIYGEREREREREREKESWGFEVGAGVQRVVGRDAWFGQRVQGFLAHKKQPPLRTLQ